MRFESCPVLDLVWFGNGSERLQVYYLYFGGCSRQTILTGGMPARQSGSFKSDYWQSA